MELIMCGRGLWYFIDYTQMGEVLLDAHKTVHKEDWAIELLILSIEDECISQVISMRDPRIVSMKIP